MFILLHIPKDLRINIETTDPFAGVKYFDEKLKVRFVNYLLDTSASIAMNMKILRLTPSLTVIISPVKLSVLLN